MYFYGMDYSYLVFVMPAVLLSFLAQFFVKSSFSRFSKIKSVRNMTGAQAAQLLLRKNNISDVKIAHISGSLTDNYNSSTKILSLSDSTYASTSIAAIGVAAHETGHTIQHATGYGPLAFRTILVPVANIGSRFGPLLAILGYLLGSFGTEQAQGVLPAYHGLFQLITDIGLLMFAAAVLFYIVTLPVEFDASLRAIKILREENILDEDELSGVKKVLSAAALTYVASALTAIGNLVRFFVLTNRRNGRR